MFCPECGEECKRVNENKSIYICEKCEEVYKTVRQGFKITRWERIE